MFSFSLKNCFYEYLKSEAEAFVNWEEYGGSANSGKRMRFVFDVDTCCDRFYGGFRQDWMCGGEWLPMFFNLISFKNCAQKNNFDFVFIFNGTVPADSERLLWEQEQTRVRMSAHKVFEEGAKTTNQYWVPPLFLVDTLSTSLVQLNLPLQNQPLDERFFMLRTVDDHEKEIVKYCTENECRGLFTSNMELLSMFVIEKYYHNNRRIGQLRLLWGDVRITHDFQLFGIRFDMDVMLKYLKMDAYQYGYFVILCGMCKCLPEECFHTFYKYLLGTNFEMDSVKAAYRIINKLIEYVRNQAQRLDKRSFMVDCNNKLFHRWTSTVRIDYGNLLIAATNRMLDDSVSKVNAYFDKVSKMPATQSKNSINNRNNKNQNQNHNNQNQNQNYNQNHIKNHSNKNHNYNNNRNQNQNQDQNHNKNHNNKNQNNNNRNQNQNHDHYNRQQQARNLGGESSLDEMRRAVANFRESDVVYHLITKRTIFLPAILEPDQSSQMMRADELFRPVRERFYALLFDKQCGPLTVTEVFFNTASNVCDKFIVEVRPSDVDVRKLEKLNKAKKMNKFLELFELTGDKDFFFPRQPNIQFEKSSYTALIACTILRYILQRKFILNDKDIRAFLATFCVCATRNGYESFNEYLEKKEDYELTVNPRAVHLASLFMYGLQTAFMVNRPYEAFWNMTFLMKSFFDGKIFQYFYALNHFNLPNHEYPFSVSDKNSINSHFEWIARGLYDNFRYPIDMSPYSMGLSLKASELASLTSTNADMRGVRGRNRGILSNGIINWASKRLITSQSLSKLSLLPENVEKKSVEKRKAAKDDDDDDEPGVLESKLVIEVVSKRLHSKYLREKAEREKVYEKVDQRFFIRFMADEKTIKKNREELERQELQNIQNYLKTELRDKNNKIRLSRLLPPWPSKFC